MSPTTSVEGGCATGRIWRIGWRLERTPARRVPLAVAAPSVGCAATQWLAAYRPGGADGLRSRIGFAHQHKPLESDDLLLVLANYWHQLNLLLDPG